MTGTIHATLTDATFVEVTIDDLTAVLTPVPNGLCVRVSAMAFSVPLNDFPPALGSSPDVPSHGK